MIYNGAAMVASEDGIILGFKYDDNFEYYRNGDMGNCLMRVNDNISFKEAEKIAEELSGKIRLSMER